MPPRAGSADDRTELQQRLEEIREYGHIPKSIPAEHVTRQAKYGLAVEDWMRANEIDCAGIQCWTSIQQNYGCAACLTMSMLGERLIPCACEVDVAGVLSMYALVLASGNPAAILDWNNNYAEDRGKCVCTHCSNYPRGFMGNPVEISNLDVLGKTLGPENCFGAIKGKVKAGDMTYFRLSTDDRARAHQELSWGRPLYGRPLRHGRRDRGHRGAGSCRGCSNSSAARVSNIMWRWCAGIGRPIIAEAVSHYLRLGAVPTPRRLNHETVC